MSAPENFDDLSPNELMEKIKELLDTPAMREMQESCTPRIYVTFMGTSDGGATYGPYISASISGDELEVEEGGEDAEEFCLATLGHDGWVICDGFETRSVYPGIRLHTFVSTMDKLRKLIRDRRKKEGGPAEPGDA